MDIEEFPDEHVDLFIRLEFIWRNCKDIVPPELITIMWEYVGEIPGFTVYYIRLPRKKWYAPKVMVKFLNYFVKHREMMYGPFHRDEKFEIGPNIRVCDIGDLSTLRHNNLNLVRLNTMTIRGPTDKLAKTLEVLSFVDNPFDLVDLNPLVNLRELSITRSHADRMYNKDREQHMKLPDAPNMKILTIDASGDEINEQILKYKKLQELKCWSLDGDFDFPELKKLEIRAREPLSIDTYSKLKNLEELILNSEWIKWETVVEFPHLKELDIKLGDNYSGFIQSLPYLKKLKSMNVTFNNGITNVIDLTHLRLEELFIVSLRSFNLLKLPKSLKTLSVWADKIELVEELPNLDRLRMNLNSDSKFDCNHLKKYPKVSEVTIFGGVVKNPEVINHMENIKRFEIDDGEEKHSDQDSILSAIIRQDILIGFNGIVRPLYDW